MKNLIYFFVGILIGLYVSKNIIMKTSIIQYHGINSKIMKNKKIEYGNKKCKFIPYIVICPSKALKMDK